MCVELPIVVGGWRVKVDPHTLERQYHRDPGHEPAEITDVQIRLLNIYANEYIRLSRADQALKLEKLANSTPHPTPAGYVVDPKLLIRELTTATNSSGTIKTFSGIIYKAEGYIYEADLEYARNHMRTPGQSCSMEYESNVIRISGYCDSSD